MLKIHQPYKSKYVFAFVSIGVLLLGSFVIVNLSSETSTVHAAGDSRTIHDISNMQEMTQQICSNTDIGDTENLLDSRGGINNYYKIMKMSDGSCWMMENLRLKSGTTITPADSDVTNDWTLPNSYINDNTVTWRDDNDTAYMADGDANMKVHYSGSRWKEAYGNYYSWCAATAMSCKLNRTGAALDSNTDAAESICPKGWRLPVGTTGVGSFQNLYNKYPNDASAGWTIGQTISYNGGTDVVYSGLKLGADSVDALFPAAGNAGPNGLDDTAAIGYYWSRRTTSSAGVAYYLYFHSGDVNPQNGSYRYLGFPVRCINDPDAVTPGPIWQESTDSNVNVTMPTVITIDAASGMQGTAEANKITEGTIIAKVTSNGEHEVLLSAVEPSLKDPKVTTAEISPASPTNPVQPGNNAWGIWNGKTNSYDSITKEAKTYDETIINGADSQKIHTYQVGISISPALPAGTYATEVTVTAAAK